MASDYPTTSAAARAWCAAVDAVDTSGPRPAAADLGALTSAELAAWYDRAEGEVGDALAAAALADAIDEEIARRRDEEDV